MDASSLYQSQRCFHGAIMQQEYHIAFLSNENFVTNTYSNIGIAKDCHYQMSRITSQMSGSLYCPKV